MRIAIDYEILPVEHSKDGNTYSLILYKKYTSKDKDDIDSIVKALLAEYGTSILIDTDNKSISGGNNLFKEAKDVRNTNSSNGGCGKSE